MTISKNYIENLLKAMDFKLQNGSKNIWQKSYSNHDDYIIKVDFDIKEINYETDEKSKCVLVSNKTVTNFSKPENFVVLECINRLLTQGYKPNTLELEHTWSSGHGTSARLDIMVKKNSKCYLMIECKTFGKEFEKEKANTLQTKKVGSEKQPKGQLFSYCFQEKSTQYLCLYSSKFNGNNIKIENAIIAVEDNWKTLSNQMELFDYWNKSFKKNGIFEPYIKPYNIECKALLRGDLEKITNEDSSRIFNQFLEILRHNAVSDKPNAFNKILNLFICKIVDEDRNINEELKFQWKDDSTYVRLQSNLEELYKQGMHMFLDIEVTDYSDADINKALIIMDTKSKSVIKKMFQELRLQKNPEFAFKEVYNKESFEENAKVLKEVVELLQPYQFRYGHKQQFLGDFFEQLLNTSIKQESGQFFTPVPIARFMITSLPLKEVIDKNVENNNKELLPFVIDYACGAGHFLTEYMDIIQTIINNYDTTTVRPKTKNKIEKWKQNDNVDETQGEFEWASDYVYGIEKDYRLVKTTKISTFLNGDGQANIIHADGLDKFSSEKFKGLLYSNTCINNNFDFIIANPPYSVSAFKQTLPSNEDDFELYPLLTENSSEIECLFVERATQLLKDGGCAAIILPSSILSNAGNIYEKTRDILLKNFYIRAIVQMGQKTFMATGTNTVILFIEKRPSLNYSIIQKLIDEYWTTYKDFSYSSQKNVLNKFVEECFRNISVDDYKSFIMHKTNAVFKSTDYFSNLRNTFENSKKFKYLKIKKEFKSLSQSEKENKIEDMFYSYIDKIEKNKLMYFLLTFTQETLLIKTGEKQKEKDFLGYEFSSRRGHEGIHYYINEINGCIDSKLYDQECINENDKKINYYINKMFKNESITIPENLAENLKYTNSANLLNFSGSNFINTIVLTKKTKPIYNCESGPLSQYVTIKIGGTPSRQNHSYFTGKNLWVSISEMNGQVITDTKEKITNDGVANSNVKLIKKGTTLLSFKLSIGKVAIAGKDLYTNEAIAALEIRRDYKNLLLDEYLFYLFKLKIIDIEGDTKAFGISLNSKTLGEIIIPKPSISEQEKFIEEHKELDKKMYTINSKKDVFTNKKQEYIDSIQLKNTNKFV
ncbi:N-6 DNA methylase [Clostridium tyrobutyricum]|jgi:type I restriction enzyme M protein|uniref:N-6 DNA methylase n=1 Tax=Clostridium tyrobutyricum TaxID=1519 RepID=UPI0010A9FED1|nr:N-6 DNA methylase [Clostridium tyrobutyricum]MBV4431579.1 N-6 DNA methylase [Clostridium tyrobutyricum]QCH29439.1 Type IIS restriction enzyme Eco57I [Clostridium tyrobutyricum]